MSNTRKRPAYNRLRQADWLLWRLASEHHCCFCGHLLMEGFDKKKLNITVHHLEGSIHTDNRNKPAPIDSQLFAHCACHKAYHQIERLMQKGRNVDTERFAAMEANVRREVNRIELSKKFYK